MEEDDGTARQKKWAAAAYAVQKKIFSQKVTYKGKKRATAFFSVFLFAKGGKLVLVDKIIL